MMFLIFKTIFRKYLIFMIFLLMSCSNDIKHNGSFQLGKFDLSKWSNPKIAINHKNGLEHHSRRVSGATVLLHNDKFYMIYGGCSTNSSNTKRYMFCSESNDGLNWTPSVEIKDFKTVSVLHESGTIIEETDKYSFWYDRWNGKHWAIYYAWAKNDRPPSEAKWHFDNKKVFDPTQCSKHNDYAVVHPFVIKTKDGFYDMWVSCYTKSMYGNVNVEYAYSKDGFNFSKSIKIIDYNIAGTRSNHGVYSPKWINSSDSVFQGVGMSRNVEYDSTIFKLQYSLIYFEISHYPNSPIIYNKVKNIFTKFQEEKNIINITGASSIIVRDNEIFMYFTAIYLDGTSDIFVVKTRNIEPTYIKKITENNKS